MKTLKEYIRESREEIVERFMLGKVRVMSNNNLKREASNYIEQELDNFDEIDSGEKFGVPLELWVDNDNIYKDNGHKPWIYFRNGYDEESDYIPMVISDDPYIPYDFVRNVDDNDLMKTYTFVKKNKLVLISRAKGKISGREFYSSLKRNAICESYDTDYMILEMARLTNADTGIKPKIYVGSTKRSGHANSDRIKVENPYGSKNSEHWLEMFYKNGEIVIPRPEQIKIPMEDIESVKQWLEVNWETIKDYEDHKISQDEMLERLVKIVDGKPQYPSPEFEYYKDGGFGFRIVKNVKDKPGKFNYVNQDNKPISDKWFDVANPFKEKNGKQVAFVVLDGINKQIDTNGTLS